MKQITLLDSKIWEVADLLTKMKSDEFYYNYLGKAALSSSLIKKIAESPKAYKQEIGKTSKPSAAMIEGRLFHQAILEPHLYEKYVFIDCKTKASKIYKDAINNDPENAHLYYTTADQYKVERLVDAFLRNNQATSLLKHSEFEKPQIGMIQDIPFRGKADIYQCNNIVDLKTSLSIKSWDKRFKNRSSSPYTFDYDVQAFIYCTLFKVNYRNFLFLVIDKRTTDIGIFDIDEDFYLSGEQKTYEAIQVYKQFILEGVDLDSYTIRGTL